MIPANMIVRRRKSVKACTSQLVALMMGRCDVSGVELSRRRRQTSPKRCSNCDGLLKNARFCTKKGGWLIKCHATNDGRRRLSMQPSPEHRFEWLEQSPLKGPRVGATYVGSIFCRDFRNSALPVVDRAVGLDPAAGCVRRKQESWRPEPLPSQRRLGRSRRDVLRGDDRLGLWRPAMPRHIAHRRTAF